MAGCVSVVTADLLQVLMDFLAKNSGNAAENPGADHSPKFWPPETMGRKAWGPPFGDFFGVVCCSLPDVQNVGSKIPYFSVRRESLEPQKQGLHPRDQRGKSGRRHSKFHQNTIWWVVYLPLWKILVKSVGMMAFPIYGKIKFMLKPTSNGQVILEVPQFFDVRSTWLSGEKDAMSGWSPTPKKHWQFKETLLNKHEGTCWLIELPSQRKEFKNWCPCGYGNAKHSFSVAQRSSRSFAQCGYLEISREGT